MMAPYERHKRQCVIKWGCKLPKCKNKYIDTHTSMGNAMGKIS